MRIHLWAATLLLAACLPITVQGRTASATAPTDTVRTPAVAAGAETAVNSASVVTCHLNFASEGAGFHEVPFPFGENPLVPNGGRCTGDLSCASRCCTNGICQQWP